MRGSAAPEVSFVVPTYGRAGRLRGCLRSIRDTVDAPCEIICVTGRDDEPTQDVLGAEPDVMNLVEGGRTGFVLAANRGFRAATGRFVVQLNDDCTLLPHAIENALHMLSAPANRGIGQLAFFHDTPVRRNIEREITVEGVRFVVCHARGLCYANFGMIPRALGTRLGWYDERFRMYGADPDLSLRVWHEAGLRVEPCAGALVHHAQVEDARAARERRTQDEDNDVLFEKWGLAIRSPART